MLGLVDCTSRVAAVKDVGFLDKSCKDEIWNDGGFMRYNRTRQLHFTHIVLDLCVDVTTAHTTNAGSTLSGLLLRHNRSLTSNFPTSATCYHRLMSEMMSASPLFNSMMFRYRCCILAPVLRIQSKMMPRSITISDLQPILPTLLASALRKTRIRCFDIDRMYT